MRSIADQGIRPGDEHLVVIDAHEMPEVEVAGIEARARSIGSHVRVIRHDAGGHTWGHCEVNVALDAARAGSYIVFNDDDDVVAPGAVDAVRAAIASDVGAGAPRLHVFRFVPPWRSPILPEGTRIARGCVSGQCLVTPNLPEKVGRFGKQYDGDFDFIEQTLALWGGVEAAVFHDETIVIARPE